MRQNRGAAFRPIERTSWEEGVELCCDWAADAMEENRSSSKYKLDGESLIVELVGEIGGVESRSRLSTD